MSLQQAFVGSLAIETTENYAVAEVASQELLDKAEHPNDGCDYFSSDEDF